MAAKNCTVKLRDADGLRHSVDVAAESLYEAAVLAISALGREGWTGRLGPGTQLEITVAEPVVRHVLTVGQIEKWLEGATPSPHERIKKAKLKLLFGERHAS